ncbi:MAG: class I SAM-dependent methyltransferase [Sedimentisphaerales bacterium]|nr:class I SAM-dependent methyltransferase [Sedimentisphaerales bacterium]
MENCVSENSYQQLRPGFFNTVRLSLKRFGLLRSLSLYFMLKDEEHKFVRSARSNEDRKLRISILSQIKAVYRNIMCLHFPFHFVAVAKFILDMEVDGPIVECGAYKGGSSAQLSVIAKETGRRLYVCDSFQGLPSPNSPTDATAKIFNDSRVHTFKEGDYAATLEEVKSNISKHAYIEVCEFVPGFFSESLPDLEAEPAVIILDVDLVSSARDCLKYLWPRLRKGGYVFTHEAESETYIKGLMDGQWWQDTLGECPPVIFGAGSSLLPVAEGLAMFRKE